MNKKNTADKEKEIEKGIEAEIKNELKSELKNELREKLKDELKAEILKEMKEELLQEKSTKETVKPKEETKVVVEVKEEPKKEEEKKHKDIKSLDDITYNLLWEGKPCGLLERFLTKIHLNFTTYQITKDELIVITGFFKRRLNSCELYLLKDPDLTDNIYQRFLNISTLSVKVDTHVHGTPSRTIKLRNIENGSKIRKLLRDAIEADVMERQITYFDKV